MYMYISDLNFTLNFFYKVDITKISFVVVMLCNVHDILTIFFFFQIIYTYIKDLKTILVTQLDIQ